MAPDNSGFFNSFFGGKRPKATVTPGGGTKLEQPPMTLKASGSLSEREFMETEVISTFPAWSPCRAACGPRAGPLTDPPLTAPFTELLLDSYFTVVKRTVADMVPKAIMLNLVNYAKENMQKELLNDLYKNRSYEEVMKESEVIIQRRSECRKMIEVLTKAEEAIGNV